MTTEDTLFVNCYLPSGTNKRHERENFIRTELPYFFQQNTKRVILGGDFNCVLLAKDQRGHNNPSPALQMLVSELQLRDTWEKNAW